MKVCNAFSELTIANAGPFAMASFNAASNFSLHGVQQF
jgi:hypothetical protein